jgi:hypothetical protein
VRFIFHGAARSADGWRGRPCVGLDANHGESWHQAAPRHSVRATSCGGSWRLRHTPVRATPSAPNSFMSTKPSGQAQEGEASAVPSLMTLATNFLIDNGRDNGQGSMDKILSLSYARKLDVHKLVFDVHNIMSSKWYAHVYYNQNKDKLRKGPFTKNLISWETYKFLHPSHDGFQSYKHTRMDSINAHGGFVRYLRHAVRLVEWLLEAVELLGGLKGFMYAYYGMRDGGTRAIVLPEKEKPEVYYDDDFCTAVNHCWNMMVGRKADECPMAEDFYIYNVQRSVLEDSHQRTGWSDTVAFELDERQALLIELEERQALLSHRIFGTRLEREVFKTELRLNYKDEVPDYIRKINKSPTMSEFFKERYGSVQYKSHLLRLKTLF